MAGRVDRLVGGGQAPNVATQLGGWIQPRVWVCGAASHSLHQFTRRTGLVAWSCLREFDLRSRWAGCFADGDRHSGWFAGCHFLGRLHARRSATRAILLPCAFLHRCDGGIGTQWQFAVHLFLLGNYRTVFLWTDLIS